MNQETLHKLIEKYINETATAAEREELLSWYRNKNQTEVQWPSGSLNEEEVVKKRMLDNIHNEIYKSSERSSFRKIGYRSIAAAMVILFISLGIYYKNLLFSEPDTITAKAEKDDLLPGGNKAVLTLADGSTIILDNASNGVITEQGRTAVKKTKDGQLIYDIKELQTEPNDKITYNTISTPRGGKYQVILPDGTNVWLNAASSLRFPTAFKGDERNVELTGEAYFEVAKNKTLPFKVISERQTVRVLGTHFNINSYADEPSIRTTLLEGSVELVNHATNDARLLEPGYQSIIPNGRRNTMLIRKADIASTIAWKEGMFNFRNSDLKAIMRQVSRWYDVDVSYKGKPPVEKFSGEIPSDIKASVFLEMLSFAGVKFEISGRNIIVITE